MAKKNTIRLTESDLKKIISESVKKVLKEDTERVINVEYDENTSFSKGRKYYYCHDNGRYYTNIDGEWYICTDNYYLEPDVHVDPNVKIITESVKKVLNETSGLDTDNHAEASYFQIMRFRLSSLSNSSNPKISSKAREILNDIKHSNMTPFECLKIYWDETQELKKSYDLCKNSLGENRVIKENNKSFDFKKELLRLTQNYLRELYGYTEGCRDSIDNDMELNDAIYQTIESVTDLRDYLKMDEPFKRGVSQGNLSFTDITGDI